MLNEVLSGEFIKTYSLPNHVVRELKDAKSGLVEAKGRVKCAKDVLDYTNKIKRYILTAKIKGRSLFPLHVILEDRRLR